MSITCVRRTIALLRTLCAAKSFLGVHSTLVRSKVACRLKRHVALLTSGHINIRAGEWFSIQVYGYNMLLESRMLPKRFIAGRVFGTTKLVPSIMRSQMPAQPRASNKALVTTRAVTYIISNTSVSTLDVVVQMGHPQKALVAIVMRTFK